MDDENQIEIPPSFVAVYSTPSGHRLTAPIATVRQRFELCEDLAQMLTEQATTTKFKLDAPERQVLEAIRDGLLGSDSSVQPAEAHWVVRRLAELLEWRGID